VTQRPVEVRRALELFYAITSAHVYDMYHDGIPAADARWMPAWAYAMNHVDTVVERYEAPETRRTVRVR